MTDFVFMVKNSSYMFITGPDVIAEVTHEEVSKEALGGAMTHNSTSGVAHFASRSDTECLARIRRLLSFLPSNNSEQPPVASTSDAPLRGGQASLEVLGEAAVAGRGADPVNAAQISCEFELSFVRIARYVE